MLHRQPAPISYLDSGVPASKKIECSRMTAMDVDLRLRADAIFAVARFNYEIKKLRARLEAAPAAVLSDPNVQAGLDRTRQELTELARLMSYSSAHTGVLPTESYISAAAVPTESCSSAAAEVPDFLTDGAGGPAGQPSEPPDVLSDI